MKKIIAGVLALTLVCGFIPFNNNTTDKYTVYAQGETAEYTEGTYGVLYYKNHGDYIEITGCDTTVINVEIPSEIDGVAVTKIGNFAFGECEALTSVTIPESVTSIGDDAFRYCKFLTSVTIPDSVTSIGDDVFTLCYALISINVSEANDYYSSVDGVLFNKDITAIIKYPAGKTDTEYIIPDSVTNIDVSAFESCKTLTSITFPNGVTSIGEYAFAGCESLTSVTIPNGVTSIEKSAFGVCKNLTSVTIPNSVTRIRKLAFAYCEALTSITIPDSVTYIDLYAFFKCNTLTSVTIENPNCTISDSALTISNKYDEFTGTIYGYENSTAQAYAEKYNRKFDTLENAPTDTPTLPLGDINGNNIVDSSDASNVLAVYALVSTGKESGLTAEQKTAADVNGDGKYDSIDASLILAYYSHIQTGGTGTIEDYLKS